MEIKNVIPSSSTPMRNFPPRPETPEICYPYPLYKSSENDKSSLLMKPNQVNCVTLHGIHIVSLIMEGKERLCLAQISNTLLKEYSYNEIHNRRVALGITCVQCTPVQLEILRRAGAMPISSRRCGMITKREAERLCKSFLGDNSPPKLPENFAFEVFHECAWGCRGQFVPARYNSSRAKCIKCHYCSLFFSPNKFVFHSHRLSDNDKYVQPDAANFNSWRRHTKLLGDPADEVVYAWEDIKAMFNGGTRKRIASSSSSTSATDISPRPADSLHSKNNLDNEDLDIEEEVEEEIKFQKINSRENKSGKKRKPSKSHSKNMVTTIPTDKSSTKSNSVVQNSSNLQEYFWPHHSHPPPTFPLTYPFLWPHTSPTPKMPPFSSAQSLCIKSHDMEANARNVFTANILQKKADSQINYYSDGIFKSPYRSGASVDFAHWIEQRRSFMNSPLIGANQISAFKPFSNPSAQFANETCEVSTTVEKDDEFDEKNNLDEEVIDVETTNEDDVIKKEKADASQA